MGAPLDIKGKKFGKLTALEFIRKRNKKGTSVRLWRCICECGGERICKANELTSGYYTDCGCKWNLIGKKFGSLTVLERVGVGTGKPKWLCKCDCGNKYTWTTNQLTKKNSNHCGCKKSEIARRISTATKTEASLNNLIHSYKSGARRRGIKFSLTKEESVNLFEGDCYYCGEKPSNLALATKTSEAFLYNGIDRIDSSGDYTVDNTVSSCFICNFMKKDLNQQEFINHIHKIVNKHPLYGNHKIK